MNFAEKNPATAENNVHIKIESINAIIAVPATPRVEYISARRIPKNETVVSGFRDIQVINVPKVTIRPTDKSVPPSKINPATPNA